MNWVDKVSWLPKLCPSSSQTDYPSPKRKRPLLSSKPKLHQAPTLLPKATSPLPSYLPVKDATESKDSDGQHVLQDVLKFALLGRIQGQAVSQSSQAAALWNDSAIWYPQCTESVGQRCQMETVENLEGVVDILNKKWHNLVQTWDNPLGKLHAETNRLSARIWRLLTFVRLN